MIHQDRDNLIDGPREKELRAEKYISESIYPRLTVAFIDSESRFVY